MSRKFVASVGIVAAAATLGLYLSRGPWLAYREQKMKADAATKEMQKAEHNKTELEIISAGLESPMGKQTAARKNGYRKSNETPLQPGGAAQDQ